MAGLGLGLVAFLFLVVVGVVDSDGSGEIVLVVVQFASLGIAGYVAGRLSTRSSTFDGGIAGMLVFVVVTVISVAGGSSLGVAPLVFLGLVAAVLGSAGGVLAEAGRRSAPPS